MKTYTITTDTGLTLYYEFETTPTQEQLDQAVAGIGGRPADRKPPSK